MILKLILQNGVPVVLDSTGAQVTDRNILEQLSFEPWSGTEQTVWVTVDTPTIPAILPQLNVNININTQR